MSTETGVESLGSVVPGSLGILGGTFDPIHYGHLAIAEEAREVLGLEAIVFIPAAIPPHKTGRIVTAPSHRLAMVELATADNACFRVSTIELERPGPSYTVDTIAALAAQAKAEGRSAAMTFVMSTEALAELRSWHEPDRLLELCRLAVVPREGYRTPARAWLAEHFPGREDRVVFLKGPRVGISASTIRALAASGRSIRYLVPPSVAAYIAEHRLYEPDLWRKN